MRKWGFAIPLLLPLLFVVSVLRGGPWTFAVLAFIFGAIPLLDVVLGRDKLNPIPEQVPALELQWFYRIVLYAWVPLQIGLLAWLFRYVDNAALSLFELVGVALSAGALTGGIGITVAHELGHKRDKWEQWLGRLLLMTVCYMHFHIEHNKGHHARVATPLDPATAREGQGFYAFLPRTLVGGLKSAWHFERDRLAREKLHAWDWRNQVLWGFTGSIAMLLVAAALGGSTAIAVFLAQAAFAVLLLEVVNYVEHYGLARAPREQGGYERVTVLHSWNASERFTNWFLFNLQRHSHHHVEHHRRYQALQHVEDSPQLPAGYAGMVLLALVPFLWRRVMDPRLTKWREKRLS